jgi:hypothetical protein
MANFLLPLLTLAAARAKAKFHDQTRHLAASQEDTLKQLLQRSQHTEFGRQYHLSEVKTIEQFRDRLPVTTYADYQPYTERIANGEVNVLSPEPVVYMGMTSGSTGKQKLIPMTRRFGQALQRSNLASIGFALEGLQRRQRRFGKLLVTNSVQLLGETPGGIPYGLATVGSLRMGKFLFEQAFAHPYELLRVGDSLSRHYLCLLFALRQAQMRGISANFPMLVLRTCKYLQQFAPELIADLESGQIASWLKLDPATRQQLERQWSAAPQRAEQLRGIFETTGKLTPKAAWPDLSFVVTARGGTSNFYFEQFPEYFGDIPVFGGVYGTTEATYGVYPDFDQDGSILAIASGFFEFIPANQPPSAHPSTLLPMEVKVGQRYQILVSNDSGFYRYDIGDVVEVVGFYEQTPLIVFCHRLGGQLSSTSEKTTEFHVTQVMQTLQQEFSVSLEDFCVTLSPDSVPAHYLVNIELAKHHALNHPQTFLSQFDQRLQAINPHYAIMRVDQVPAPRLRILAPGSFNQVRQGFLDRGMPDSQLKIPHISEDRNFLADLTVEQELQLT